MPPRGVEVCRKSQPFSDSDVFRQIVDVESVSGVETQLPNRRMVNRLVGFQMAHFVGIDASAESGEDIKMAGEPVLVKAAGVGKKIKRMPVRELFHQRGHGRILLEDVA